MNGNLRVFADAHAASVACGEQILEWLGEAISLRGTATLAISGGTTPGPMFENFARAEFPWEQVSLFWVDERCVPPGDPQSNYRLARETWLEPGRFPESNIHRVRTELEPEDAARLYAAELPPRFDVIHRGMGADGHTASLFPGAPQRRDTGAAAALLESKKQWRVTLTADVLETARHTAMLVAGADKASTLNAVLNGPLDPLKYPAQIASRDGSNAVWFIDQTAASQLAAT